MKSLNNLKSSLSYDKHLFYFYLKKRMLSIKFILCVLLSVLIGSLAQSNSRSLINISSHILDKNIFWQNFLGTFSLAIFPLYFPIIIAADIVSAEFSNRSAMIIYSMESRNKVLSIKLLSLIISIFILNLSYFLPFLIFTYIRTSLLVSFHIFLMGFLIIFIEFIFISLITFMTSALTRNTFVSFILPFFYISVETNLEYFELGLLSYTSYQMKVISFFENFLFNEQIIVSIVKSFSIIMFFGLPLLIILITFYCFKQLDIRID